MPRRTKLRLTSPSALFRVGCFLITYVIVFTTTPVVPRSAVASAPSPGSSSRPAGVRGRAAAAAQDAARWRAGELLVRFRPDAPEQAITTLLASQNLQRGSALRGGSRVERLTLSAGQEPQLLAALLSASPAVEFAEPNFIIKADQVAPNDPRFPEQWALFNAGAPGGDIGVTRAWPAARGSARTVIAVIDGGVDFTHPDLRRNQWINLRETGGAADADQNGYAGDRRGWDWVTNSGEIKDGSGHGTAVAGVIAAEGNNGTGTTGVMWRASLMSLRVLDDAGTGDVASAVEAIDYAVANGARVVNMSWGAGDASAALKDALVRAASRSVLFVCSAGNGGQNIDTSPHYPASYDLPDLVSVASTDISDALAPFSNWGAARATVAAPGVNILTTKPGGGYDFVSGTSASAPLVTGVVGLFSAMSASLTAVQLKAAVIKGARPVPALSGRVAAGGVVNASLTLEAIGTLLEGTRANERSSGANGNAPSGGIGNGDAARNSVRPLPASRQPATNDLPNLDDIRRRRHEPPRVPDAVPSTRFSPGDGPRGRRASHQALPAAPARTTLLARLTNFSIDDLALALGVRGVALNVPEADYYRSHATSDSRAATEVGVSVGGLGGETGLPRIGTEVSNAPLLSSVFAMQAPPYDASFSGQSVPTSMVGGQAYNVSVTMTNTGSNTWTSGELYRLGEADSGAWGLGRIHLTAPVPPGASATFNFTVIAPTSPGSYGFQWRMVRDGATWFGANSTNVTVNVSAPPSNLSINRPATQSSEGWGGTASRAVDGNTSGNWNDASTTHTNYDSQAWWQVDLGGVQQIGDVRVWGRTDCCGERLSNFYVLVSDSPFTSTDLTATINQAGVSNFYTPGQGGTPTTVSVNRTGRYVRVQLSGTDFLSLAEVQVLGGKPARLLPTNRVGAPGEDLLSRNYNWSVPLLGLKGRSGLDLGLSLAYNSLVWTKEGSTMVFDGDGGDPTPGFRLGFPVVKPQIYDGQAGAWAYLLILPSGGRVELRQTAPYTYESVDSSYLRLEDHGGGLLDLWTPDGTRMRFFWRNVDHRCAEIRDRNGNYISVAYNGAGNVSTIADTLGRVVTFTYDAYNKPLSITQTWWREQLVGGAPQTVQETHEWATFGYGNVTVQTSYSGMALLGVQNGNSVPVLTQVGFTDGTRFNFDYTTYAQVYRVTRSTMDEDHVWRQRAYTQYNLPLNQYAGAQADCPRFTERRDWAAYLNGDADGVAGAGEESVTTFTQWDPTGASGQVTTPDGTIYKEFYGTAGQSRGLLTRTEFWSGGAMRKWTTSDWTQDNWTLDYPYNPRVFEANVYDAEGNRRHTSLNYGPDGLADDVYEFGSDGATLIRRTHTDYNLSQVYTDRHIIGLVGGSQLYEGLFGALQSKVEYSYDAAGEFMQQQGTPAQHDSTNYGAGLIAGRGNMTGARRYDVNNTSQFTESVTGYNTTGSVVFTRDPGGHQTTISYADAFFNPNDPNSTANYNTYAYPTTVTDPDNYSSTVQYYYDFGATRRAQDPKGAAARTYYDKVGRVERAANLVNNAYTRLVYATNNTFVQSSSLVDTGVESDSFQLFNGAGGVRASAASHPNSVGGYSASYTIYDQMGRVGSRSNPHETNADWVPVGADASGYQSVTQTYDWKGRPLVTTNLADGTTKQVTYGGCGCAGGEVVTVQDEIGRRVRTTADALGRAWKSEVLNMDGSVYSTTTNTFNARDQVTRVYVQQGAGGAGQETLMTYDGYARLATSKAPAQGSPVSYSYDSDDVVLSVTDPRGVVATYGYAGTNRHLLKTVTYTNAPSGVPLPAQASFGYDEVGNRTSMTDGTGSHTYSYNILSQLESESRQFAGLGGSYALSYAYSPSGQLKSMTDHTGAVVSYDYDAAGRVTAARGSGPGTLPTYVSNLRYRAWGALTGMDYGNGTQTSFAYNSRLLPSRFEIANVKPNANFEQVPWGTQSATLAWTYDYYADGRLRTADDATFDRFDRVYDYDHAGRLKEAYTGREAHGLPPTSPYADNPYRQSYQYDVWGNITGKTGRLWHVGMSDVPTFTTGTHERRQGWGYDASGNVVEDDTKVHTYDAAGRQTYARSRYATVGDSSEQWPVQWSEEFWESYDGDGRPTHRSQAARHNDYECYGAQEPPCYSVQAQGDDVYYLRSSALGGAVVAELSQDGATVYKKRAYVYAAGQRVFKQDMGSAFEHHNPAGGWVATQASDRFAMRQERDPAGAELPLTDVYWTDPDPTYGELKGSAPLYIEGGDPFDYSSGATVDGLPVSQAQLAHMIDNGSVGMEVIVGGHSLGVFGITSRGLGYIPHSISVSTQQWVNDLPTDMKDPVGGPGEPEYNSEGVLQAYTDLQSQGHWETTSSTLFLFAGFGGGFGRQKVGASGKVKLGQPQNTTQQQNDPCAGVKASDLNYTNIQHYIGKDGKGHKLYEDSMQHITRRHILLDDPSQGFIRGWNQSVQPQQASKYVFQRNVPNIGDAQDLVRKANEVVFQAAKGSYSWSRGSILMEISFGPSPGTGDTVLMGIGYDARDSWTPTSTITLILADNCRDVITSYPGRP